LKKLTEFVIRLIDLLEAEGRVARRAAVEYAIAVLVWLGATIFFVAAVLVLATAIYLGLLEVASRPVALVIVAGFLVIIGGCCALLGRSISRQRPDSR
jgi:hypothetical protein